MNRTFQPTRQVLWTGLAVVSAWVVAPPATAVADAGQPPAKSIRITERLPFGQRPIRYHDGSTDDAISRLQRRLGSGQSRLQYQPDRGYLLSLLKELGVSTESQVLVFSKTAVNTRLIEPKQPRAVYFDDDIYVAWVPGAEALELAAVDPVKGGIFWTLAQRPGQPPRLGRDAHCLACHVGTSTRNVPGFMVRSFLTDRTGKPREGYSRITHETPFEKRWGGWYVTGRHGGQSHLGNLIGEKDRQQHKRDPTHGGNVTDLKAHFDVSRYPSPHSDIVAHLVLNHQVEGHNLLIRAGYESRLNRRSDCEDRLLRYLLFIDEAKWTAPVSGTSRFAEQFAERKPTGRSGRSLRQLDLKTRLFRHRLSYLIYSAAFDGLPRAVKTRLYRRLWNVLHGRDPRLHSAELPAAERAAILGILRETKRDLPEYWRKP